MNVSFSGLYPEPNCCRHLILSGNRRHIIRFREHSFQLNPGDSLFVYTDGVAEATNAGDELFGNERMLDALNVKPDANPETLLSNVMAGIDDFVAGAEQFDDITMLCLKYNGPADRKS